MKEKVTIQIYGIWRFLYRVSQMMNSKLRLNTQSITMNQVIKIIKFFHGEKASHCIISKAKTILLWLEELMETIKRVKFL